MREHQGHVANLHGRGRILVEARDLGVVQQADFRMDGHDLLGHSLHRMAGFKAAQQEHAHQGGLLVEVIRREDPDLRAVGQPRPEVAEIRVLELGVVEDAHG
ncbi:hypothetical protein D3C78_1799540 [compost metagenome]